MIKKKINLKNQLCLISELVYRLFFFVVLLYLINTYLVEFSIWLNIAMVLPILLPTIYLHLKYADRDKNKVLIIEDNGHIILEENDKKFNLSSANKIIIKGSVALTRTVVQTFISPNYYDIVFKSEEFGEVEVSSILDVKLRDVIVEKFDNQIVEYKYSILY